MRDLFSVLSSAAEIAAVENIAATVLRKLMYCSEKLYNPLSLLLLSSVMGSRPRPSVFLGIQIWPRGRFMQFGKRSGVCVDSLLDTVLLEAIQTDGAVTPENG